MARSEVKSVSVYLDQKNPYELRMEVGDEKKRFAIDTTKNFSQSTPKESQDLLRTVMLSHMIAPLMPEKIYTNFTLEFTQFINTLYDYYGYKAPRVLKLTDDKVVPKLYGGREREELFSVATSHSGGLDSVYRLGKLMENGESFLGVHLKNLNPKGNAWESEASKLQSMKWDFPLAEVKLLNNSGNGGHGAMRTRDLFLALVVAMESYGKGVKQVLVEGGMGNSSEYDFSENSEVWGWFNQLLKDSGFGVELVGIDPGDVETVGEVLEIEKNLGINMINLVQNCFSAPFQLMNNRRKWQRETPTLAKNSADRWCGSCVKCRRMSLGRIYYEDYRLMEMRREEVVYFVKDTYGWLKKYPENSDLISSSFLSHLEKLAGI